MALTDKLDILMRERGLNKAELAKGAGLPYMTVANLWKKGAENIKLSTMRKLADYLSVSLDEIAGIEDAHELPAWATAKDKRDFKKMIEEEPELMFDGVPVDEEDRKKILHAMEIIFWDAKKKNKRTPVEE